ATAEESASAAEEMNAQAQQMRAYVEELATVVGVSMERSGSSRMVAAPRAVDEKPALSEAAGNKKKMKIHDERVKKVRTRPDDIIPFDQDEKDQKDSFKDF
ncbi:MAG: hypothetical protein ACYC5X_04365, partial [Syntrophales bacterium]